MTDERDYHRDIFDQTMQMIQRGEELADTLTKAPPSDMRDRLLASTQKHLVQLKSEAEELEALGWDSGNA
ncbi:hypothetical protein [Aureimonas phyllosphaerae]|uniref:Uncharacterized protein n=1 Tax=Aureimonas phyllosphaerae TaxID=1166078 RepID=A0A7W6FWC0_9HYPH|nr:hypothetical protein [Aureimonas phyllosphaerae]MBB3938041.1 hypothetical protein [Aureimonas phyllosphaerae]MBB3962083.1 hypothetical protein [Aureimonas phyllosphaerae]SFF54979.1 hypothetical protein SAMN05216566_1263 [Aureimonas phyllosphaerae]